MKRRPGSPWSWFLASLRLVRRHVVIEGKGAWLTSKLDHVRCTDYNGHMIMKITR